jgi:translation initiation factor IF-3
MAIELNLDLVNVAPTAKPPVCRIMDYGKFRYEQQKKEKEARKNQKIVDLKEVWFRANIDENDYQTKYRNVVKFLGEGDKVKASVRFAAVRLLMRLLDKRFWIVFQKRLPNYAALSALLSWKAGA